jgi:hypothetical protein
MTAGDRSSSSRLRRRWKLIAAAVVGVLGGLFFLLFLLVNDSWVVVSIPNPPWNPDPGWAAFEARLAAVMVVSFALGALAAVTLYRFLAGEDRRRSSRDRARISELESELKNVSKLLASSRDKS